MVSSYLVSQHCFLSLFYPFSFQPLTLIEPMQDFQITVLDSSMRLYKHSLAWGMNTGTISNCSNHKSYQQLEMKTVTWAKTQEHLSLFSSPYKSTILFWQVSSVSYLIFRYFLMWISSIMPFTSVWVTWTFFPPLAGIYQCYVGKKSAVSKINLNTLLLI